MLYIVPEQIANVLLYLYGFKISKIYRFVLKSIFIFKEETLAQCTNCKYVFCALCTQGYHGIEPCKISNGIYFIF